MKKTVKILISFIFLSLLLGCGQKESEEKETLTIGIIESNQALEKYINTYREEHPEVEVIIKDYRYYEGEGITIDTFINNMMIEIVAGNGPDIISWGYSYSHQYAVDNAFIDLSEYVNERLPEDEYFTNVLESFAFQDKLYILVPEFYISTMIVQPEMISKDKLFTCEQVMEDYEAVRKNTKYCHNNVGYLIACNFFRQDYESFVNWEKGECSFKNEKFQRILEFAKTFPDEYVENIEISEVYDNWNDKKYFCEQKNIANEFCVSELNYKYGEENYYLSGVPSDKGGQHLASLFRNSYSISSNCKNIDLAYDFMDGIFEEDFQNECIKDGMSFPISRKILEDKLDAASEIEYETLEDGSQNPVVKYQIYYDYKTPGESIYQITEEEKMTVLQLIDSVSKSILVDSNITQIFYEEVGSFFEDDKSVDEVLDIMESRVQLYMSEKF